MKTLNHQKNILLYSILGLLLCSCSFTQKEKTNISIENISENIPSRKPILSDSISIFLGLPESMTLIDQKLLINDFFGEDGFIQVYDLKNKKTLSPFAKKGDGPNEFLSVSNIDSYYRNDSLFVGLFDGNYRKYTAYYRDNFTTPQFSKGVLTNYTVNELYKIKDGIN